MATNDVERGHEHLNDGVGADAALNKIRTAGSISISPELFEKIYLSPQNQVKGDLRKTFGNPTPIAIGGFLLALTPLSCDLLGWRGAGELGATSVGAYFWFGCVLMFIGGIFELILGNTFPAVVFTTFSAFWFTLGALISPSFGASLPFASSAPDGMSGNESPFYFATAGFFLLWMGFLCLIYLIAALRTNVVFVLIFLSLVLAFPFLTASFWYVAQAGQVTDPDMAMSLAAKAATMQLAGGGAVFCTSMFGWYLFLVQILASVDFPLNLPVGDLSTVIKGASDRKRD